MPPKPEGLTSTELAPILGVTDRTIRNWIDGGMPTTGTKKYKGRDVPLIDPAAAREWQAKFTNPNPPNGGKLPGGGRPKGSRNTYDEAPDGDEVTDSADRATRIEKIHNGTATKAEIEFTEAETKALEKLDAYDLSQKRLLVREDVEAAWGETLQSHKMTCHGIGARVESQTVAELALKAEQGQAIRRIVESEIAQAFKELIGKDPLEESSQ